MIPYGSSNSRARPKLGINGTSGASAHPDRSFAIGMTMIILLLVGLTIKLAVF